MPGLGTDSRLSQDASPNHRPGPPCLNCLRASSWGGRCLSPRFLKSRQLLRARESQEDYDCRPSPITPSSCPGPPENPFPVGEDVIIIATLKQLVSDILKMGA